MDFGPFVIVVALLLLPVGVFIVGAIGAWLLGTLVENDVHEQHEGTELDALWG